MSSPLQDSLVITAIGMGLVFAAIIVLWGMMELIVRITADKPAPEEDVNAPAPEENAAEATLAPDLSARKKAAAVGVAFALAARNAVENSPPPPPAPAQLSTWQAMRRATHLNQNSNFQKQSSRGTRK